MGAGSSHNQAAGAAIRSVREERGASQQEIAARAGYDLSDYALIERGEYSLTYTEVVRIARALEIPAGALMERVDGY